MKKVVMQAMIVVGLALFSPLSWANSGALFGVSEVSLSQQSGQLILTMVSNYQIGCPQRLSSMLNEVNEDSIRVLLQGRRASAGALECLTYGEDFTEVSMPMVTGQFELFINDELIGWLIIDTELRWDFISINDNPNYAPIK